MSRSRDAGLLCGIDSVQIPRIDRLLKELPPEELLKVFSVTELVDAGQDNDRTSRLAARFAAKEACLKLFPRETSLAEVAPADFTIGRNGYGEPFVKPSHKAQQILDHYRLDPIALSLTHDASQASAVAMTQPRRTRVSTLAKIAYRCFPIRRKVARSNLTRVFGNRVSDDEISRIAQAFYGHLAQSLVEFVRYSFLPERSRASLIRVENIEAPLRAGQAGKGVIMLTGHFGNWGFALPAALASFPEWRRRFHILRKTLRPKLLNAFVSRRFRRAGLPVIPARNSLDTILDLLAAGDALIFVFDQHAGGGDGILVDFFGTPAWTFRSLAIIALATGAPVIPASCYRTAGGIHVVRFEEPLETLHSNDPAESIRLNTRSYNAAIERMVLRHPEQWFWIHRRWKDERGHSR